MERSAEFHRGAIEALNRVQRDFTVTVPELQAEYVALLADAEDREAFPIPDTLPKVPEAREAGERDYLGESRQAAIARAESAEALLAGLRGALETLNHAAKVAISTEYGGCFDEETPLVIRLLDGTCDETDAALALTPASAGNWTDEETEAANGR